MTRQEVDTILRSARRHAKLKGYSFEADDFSSYCLEKIYMGRKATIGQLFIDYLREEFGDSRKHLFKNDRINKSYELLGIEPDEKKSPENEVLFKNFLDSLERNDRIIIMLSYVWGFMDQEIGDLISVSGSRVYQIRKRILKKYLKNFKKSSPHKKA